MTTETDFFFNISSSVAISSVHREFHLMFKVGMELLKVYCGIKVLSSVKFLRKEWITAKAFLWNATYTLLISSNQLFQHGFVILSCNLIDHL